MKSVTKVSRRFHCIFKIAFFASPVLGAVAWAFGGLDPDGFLTLDAAAEIASAGVAVNLGYGERIAAFAVSMFETACRMYVYWMLAKLFGLYAEKSFFEEANVTCIKNVAKGLIAMQILSLPVQLATSFILTFGNPEGERMIYLGIDDVNVSMIVVAIMIFVIAEIMDEGRKLQEEARLTV